jgi:hypothetical protein
MEILILYLFSAGQVHNVSNDNPVSQALVHDSYFQQTIPVTDSDGMRMKTQHSADKSNLSGLNIQPQQEIQVVSIQVNVSAPAIQTVQQNLTASEIASAPQKLAAVVTVDPKRKPVLHATTPPPVISFPSVSDSKQEPEAKESASSSINVTSHNRLTSEEIPTKVTVNPMGLIPEMVNFHTTGIPQGYGRIPVFPQMMIQRPVLPYNFMSHRHPVPHRGFHRPLVGVYRPQYATAASSQHNFIIKKPYYRPAPARPMTIPPQFHLPLGKTRIPLQQNSASIKTYHLTVAPSIQPLKLRKVSSTTSTSTTTPLPNTTQAPHLVVADGAAAIKPSPSIIPSEVIVLKPLDSHIPAAVNTGFNPHSVVVESGFKPIITSKNAEAQDRSVVEDEAMEVKEKLKASINKTEEAIIEDLASEVVAVIADEERKDNPFHGQVPETFEPMFIPSPPDRNGAQNSSNIKKPILVEELTPPVAHLNHRHSPQPSRKNEYPFIMIRPRPGLVRRPLFPNIVPPFHIPVRSGSPTFRYQQTDDYTEDETPMAAERMDSYLPPIDSSLSPGVAVTYDGKSVLSIPPAPVAIKSIRVPVGTADLIRETPQFAPFRGEIPPPVPDVISPENIPQLSKENQQKAQTLPEEFRLQNGAFPHPPPIERTQLLLNQQGSEEMSSDSSEIKEITAQSSKGDKPKKQAIKKFGSPKEEGEIMSTVDDRWPFSTNQENERQMEESTVTIVELDGTTLNQTSGQSSQSTEKRERRSAHHEPGHVGYDDHQHSGHEHLSNQNAAHNDSNHHDHPQHKESRATSVTFSSFLLLLSPVIMKYLQEMLILMMI